MPSVRRHLADCQPNYRSGTVTEGTVSRQAGDAQPDSFESRGCDSEWLRHPEMSRRSIPQSLEALSKNLRDIGLQAGSARWNLPLWHPRADGAGPPPMLQPC